MTTRKERDELARVLFDRMLSREPVWVNSPLGQVTQIRMIGLEDSGEIVAYDHEGNDRWVDEYLLTNPGRLHSGPTEIWPCATARDRD